MIGKRNCARLTESNFDCASKYRYLPNETFGVMNNDLPNSVMTLPLKVLTQRVGQLNVKFCEAERGRNAPGRDLEVRSATKWNRPLKGSAANCLLKRCLLPGAGPSKGSNTPRTLPSEIIVRIDWRGQGRSGGGGGPCRSNCF